MPVQLDREAQDLMDVVAAAGLPPLHSLPVAEARARMRAALIPRGPAVAMSQVTDIDIPTPHGALPIRLYRPRPGPLPAGLFFHGGGWTFNDLDTHDDLCRRLAKQAGWLLASVDYRRAPEHRHPAAGEDAYLAYRWLLDHSGALGFDPTALAVIGESSGATMAAGLTLLLRDMGAPLPSYQVLAYPMLDAPERWPSYRERGHGYILDQDLVGWFLRQYLPAGYDRSRPDPYLLPLTASDLTGLPPALVMTAEFDPLRDHGAAYAAKLAEAGVAVEHVHAPDQMHGFLLQGRAVAGALALFDRLAAALARHGATGTRTIAASVAS